MNIYLYLSMVVAIVAALAHSYLGEAKLLRPLFAEPQTGVMKSLTWRRITRAVWHLPSACWLLMAAMTLLVAQQQPLSVIPLYFASAVYLISGLGNLIATRGKHFGWLVLLAGAALVIMGLQ